MKLNVLLKTCNVFQHRIALVLMVNAKNKSFSIAGPSYNGYASSLDPHTYEIMSKYTGGYDYPQSSAVRSYSTGSSSGSQVLGSSYGHKSGYQPSQRPQRHASYGSYDTGTKYGGSSEIGSTYGGSLETGKRYGGSTDSSLKYGGSHTDFRTKYGGSSDVHVGSKYGSSDLGSKYGSSSDTRSKYGSSIELGSKYGGASEFGTSYRGTSSDKSRYGDTHSHDNSSSSYQGSDIKPQHSTRYRLLEKARHWSKLV